MFPSLSSFHLAAARGHVECLRVMFTHGVDVTAQDTTGMWFLISYINSPAGEYRKDGDTYLVEKLVCR